MSELRHISEKERVGNKKRLSENVILSLLSIYDLFAM